MKATLPIEAATHRTWDAVIVGAGPAGAVTALQLARRGSAALLIDRSTFPRWKVCGCCLNGATLGALSALGMEHVFRAAGVPRLSRMRLAVGSGAVTLPLREGVALSRETLDTALIGAAVDAGAQFLDGADAVLLHDADETRTIQLRHKGAVAEVRARIAVAADGLGGTFLRRLEPMEPVIDPVSPIGAGAAFENAPPFYEPGTIYMACGSGAYVGAVRLEDGRLDVAAAIRRVALRASAGIGPLLRATLEENRFPVPAGWARAEWKGTPALTRTRRRLAGRRLFVVGDSASYVEPFTGEGIAWAIQAAGLLVSGLPERLETWNDDLGEAWETRYRSFLRRHGRVCRLARTVLRHRGVARTAVALLGRAPWLASAWVNEISILDPGWKNIAGGESR